MQDQDRRAAIAAYKERKPAAGIYALRCAASGAVWVGQTLTLGTVWNRHLFALRLGNARPAALQTAWNTHGEAAIGFDVLEELPEEELDFARDALLKDRLAHWRAALQAQAI